MISAMYCRIGKSILPLHLRKNQTVFFFQSFCTEEFSGSREYHPFHAVLLHEAESFRNGHIEYAFRESIRGYALWSDKCHADDGILIFSGERVDEVVVHFPVDFPVPFVAARGGDRRISEGDRGDDFPGERVLYADDPARIRVLMVSARGDIASRIDEEVIISERSEQGSGPIHRPALCDAAEIERLLRLESNRISLDSYRIEIRVNSFC